MTKYILADRADDGQYYGSEILESDPQDFLAEFEYGDVVNNMFQIWEYPSGVIYQLKPDRKVDDKHYFSTPYSSRGTIWEPLMIQIAIEKDKVDKAFNTIA